jgi:hypothetical protein
VKDQNRGHQLDAVGRQQESKVKKLHQIGNCRISSGEAMLIGITFRLVRNMVIIILITYLLLSSFRLMCNTAKFNSWLM